MFRTTILTLFPELFPGPLGASLAGKALSNNLWSMDIVNIRDFALDPYQTVDDKPFGGGNGMVICPDVLGRAIDANYPKAKKEHIIYFSPRGRKIDTDLIKKYLKLDHLLLICGRFEGIDERIIEEYNVEEVSLGDFVMSGGEIAAYALLDSLVRQIKGVVENSATLKEESFGNDDDYRHLLEYPQYTRPQIWKDRMVPEILLSGDHKKIADWRLEQAKKITKDRRDDLWRIYSESDLI